MKIKVPRIFKTDTMNDHERLFCWVLGKFFNRYGWEEVYTMDAYDAKIILHGSTIRTFADSNVGTELPKYFKIAFYSDRRVGISINKNTMKYLKSYHWYNNKISVTDKETTLTADKPVLIYSYLLGILSFMGKWTYESASIVGFSDSDLDDTLSATEAMRQCRITDPFELQQLLNELG